MDYVNAIKTHPIPIAIGVGILLLIMMRGNGASQAQAVASGYNPAVALQSQALAANTDVQINGQNAQVIAANMQYQEAMSKIRAGLSSDIFNGTTSAAVALAQTGAATTANFLTHLDNQNSIAANLQSNMSSITAGQNVAFATLKNNFDMLSKSSETQLSLAGIQADIQKYGIDSGKQIALAQLNTSSQITNKSLDYKYAIDNKTIDSNNANLPALLQFSSNALEIQNAGAQQLAVINGQNTQALAAISADTLRYQTNAALLKSGIGAMSGGGGGGGILGGLFGGIGDALGGLFGGAAAGSALTDAASLIWV